MDKVWVVKRAKNGIWDIFRTREAACDAWTRVEHPTPVGWKNHGDGTWVCVNTETGDPTGVTVYELEVKG